MGSRIRFIVDGIILAQLEKLKPAEAGTRRQEVTLEFTHSFVTSLLAAYRNEPSEFLLQDCCSDYESTQRLCLPSWAPIKELAQAVVACEDAAKDPDVVNKSSLVRQWFLVSEGGVALVARARKLVNDNAPALRLEGMRSMVGLNFDKLLGFAREAEGLTEEKLEQLKKCLNITCKALIEMKEEGAKMRQEFQEFLRGIAVDLCAARVDAIYAAGVAWVQGGSGADMAASGNVTDLFYELFGDLWDEKPFEMHQEAFSHAEDLLLFCFNAVRPVNGAVIPDFSSFSEACPRHLSSVRICLLFVLLQSFTC